MLATLNQQRLQGEHCDVTVLVGGRLFSAHKCVLSATSGYFASLFGSREVAVMDPWQGGLRGRSAPLGRDTVEALEAWAFELILTFFYTAQLLVTDKDEMEGLEHAAQVLQVPALLRHIEAIRQALVEMEQNMAAAQSEHLDESKFASCHDTNADPEASTSATNTERHLDDHDADVENSHGANDGDDVPAVVDSGQPEKSKVQDEPTTTDLHPSGKHDVDGGEGSHSVGESGAGAAQVQCSDEDKWTQKQSSSRLNEIIQKLAGQTTATVVVKAAKRSKAKPVRKAKEKVANAATSTTTTKTEEAGDGVDSEKAEGTVTRKRWQKSDGLHCAECLLTFETPADHRAHRKTHYKRAKKEMKFECTTCGKTMTTRHSFKEHQRLHTGEKPYKCSQCDASFTIQTNLRTHMRKHSGEKPFVCESCGQCFRNRSTLTVHRRRHTQERPYACTVCGARFRQSDSCKTHMRIHTGEKPFECNVCGKTFANRGNLPSHMRLHTGERLFQCEYCGKKFTLKGTMQKHVNSIHNPQNVVKPSSSSLGRRLVKVETVQEEYCGVTTSTLAGGCFECSACALQFSRQTEFVVHMAGHNGLEVLPCTVCKKLCVGQEALERHTKAHKHVCEICGKNFTSSNNLTQHMNLHLDVRPYKCQYCDVAFHRNNSLWSHIKARHNYGLPAYQCTHCNKRFATPSQLTHHLRYHTGERFHACELCGRMFVNRSGLQRHTCGKPVAARRKRGPLEEGEEDQLLAENGEGAPVPNPRPKRQQRRRSKALLVQEIAHLEEEQQQQRIVQELVAHQVDHPHIVQLQHIDHRQQVAEHHVVQGQQIVNTEIYQQHVAQQQQLVEQQVAEQLLSEQEQQIHQQQQMAQQEYGDQEHHIYEEHIDQEHQFEGQEMAERQQQHITQHYIVQEQVAHVQEQLSEQHVLLQPGLDVRPLRQQTVLILRTSRFPMDDAAQRVQAAAMAMAAGNMVAIEAMGEEGEAAQEAVEIEAAMQQVVAVETEGTLQQVVAVETETTMQQVVAVEVEIDGSEGATRGDC
ncbi:zinc finger and BTB domain-containing protein 17-like isoform X2 [Lethenteron reissneri]|uniref:zinc finger and BTB domain-containing protein 17-like isoform X2 n=1 Tax=Lethenteron reissneri TaxID=7753 RepID=UPI002AB68BDE|nr:zinc finger and BTB domain-containing protein 17-like isoform X2 [Lethenteron reissneri]